MKYPAKQFEQLKDILTQLAEHFDITQTHPCSLHYTAWEQSIPLGKGHDHNIMYIVNNDNIMDAMKNNGGITQETCIVRAHKLPNGVEGLKRIVGTVCDFQLYPDGCDDSHIETAVKAAIKQLKVN